MSALRRREFSAATLAGAGVFLAPRGLSAAGFAANETVNLAGIGCGGRFQHLMKSLPKLPGVRLAGICDVDDSRLAACKSIADPKAVFTKRFEEVLARKDIDAVVIAAPDHWHADLLIAALDAGKHAYVEKPLTHDLSEGPRIRFAAEGKSLTVQVGMQQRSMPHVQKARELIQAGRIGTVHKVHITWNRNQSRATSRGAGVDPNTVDWSAFLGRARVQPFDPFRLRQWRWFWDFGGGILTDLMVHWMDIAQWVLDPGAPGSAVTIGGNYQTAGLWETPDTIQALFDYPAKQLQVHFEGTFVNARRASSLEFMGTKGTVYLDRGRLELTPERGSGEPMELVLGKGPKGADFYETPDGELLHLTDFVTSLKAGKPASVGIEAGIQAVWAAHLGNLAFRESRHRAWPGER
jgi:predicted dehydrogenase